MNELLARFLIGGVVVSAFALCGDVLKPKTFAGLFGAAPSVALATLELTIARQGPECASLEGRTMIAGAVSFFAYVICAHWVMMRFKVSVTLLTIVLLPVWLGVAVAIWYGWLR
jgi:uncharacterized membrane protein (GlpM family)